MTEIGINVGGAAKREIGFRPGPVFFLDGDTVMFQIGLDASTIIGPNPMKEKNRLEHQEQWFRFCDQNPDYDLRTGERKSAAPSDYTRHSITYERGGGGGGPLPQLDHDGDGEPGGSIPEADLPEAEEKALILAELIRLGYGKPHPRTGLSKLRAALEEALAEQ